MINYPYPTLFLTEGTQKDLLITDGTVTVVGTTYTVSDETVLIDNSVLDYEAFELYQSLNSEMQIEFGSCDTGSIRFTIRKDDNSNIVGTVLKVYLIPNHDASKMLQLGVFTVAEDVRSQDHKQHTIVAHDAMYDILNSDVSDWYNSILPDDVTSVTVSEFRDSLLDYFGITAEAISLVNDSRRIRRTIKNIAKEDGTLSSVSGAEIIKSVCQINGVFGTITNEGKLRYVSLVDPISSSADTTDIPVSYWIEVNNDEAFNPFRTLIVKSQEATASKSLGVVIGGRNTYTIANNILINDYSQDELKDLVDALFPVIDGHAYTPFSLAAIGNPLHEVGDPVKIYKPDGSFFYSYIFERRMTGIQALRDTYTTNGSSTWDGEVNSPQSQYEELASSAATGRTNSAWKLRSARIYGDMRYYLMLTKNQNFVGVNSETAGHKASNDVTDKISIGTYNYPFGKGYFKILRLRNLTSGDSFNVIPEGLEYTLETGDWVSDSGIYVQTHTINGLKTASDNMIVDCYPAPGSISDFYECRVAAFATDDNEITFFANSIPLNDLNIVILAEDYSSPIPEGAELDAEYDDETGTLTCMWASPSDASIFLDWDGDTLVIDKASYTVVSPIGTENPREEGWYIYDSANDEYLLTSDTSVDSEQTYYSEAWATVHTVSCTKNQYKESPLVIGGNA